MTDAERAALHRCECGTTTTADADTLRAAIEERDRLRAATRDIRDGGPFTRACLDHDEDCPYYDTHEYCEKCACGENHRHYDYGELVALLNRLRAELAERERE